MIQTAANKANTTRLYGPVKVTTDAPTDRGTSQDLESVRTQVDSALRTILADRRRARLTTRLQG